MVLSILNLRIDLKKLTNISIRRKNICFLHPEFIFFAALLFLGVNLVLYSVFEYDAKLMLRGISSVFLCLFLILKNGMNFNLKFVLLLSASFLILLFSQSAAINVVWLIFFIFCCQNEDYNKILCIFCKVSCVITFSIFILLLLGKIDVQAVVIGERVRGVIGEQNPNSLSLLLFSLLSPFLLKNDTLITKVLGMFLLYVVYLFTNSRTVFMGYCIYLIAGAFFTTLLKPRVIISTLLVLFFTSIFLCPLYIPYLIENYSVIDEILSFRLSFFSEYINTQSIANYILGGSLPTDIPLDNAYVLTLFSTGIVFYVLWYLLSVYSSMILYVNARYNELSFVIATTSMGLFESYLVRPEFYLSLLYWLILFCPYKSIREKQQKYRY